LVFILTADVLKTEREITLPTDMPWVAANDIHIDFKDGVLTLIGNVNYLKSI